MLSQNYPSPGLAEATDVAGTVRPAPDPSARDASQLRKAVLIVEDEQASRTALSRLLTQSGYANLAVGSAEEALRVIDGGGVPRVALVDLNLPGMSGLDLIGRLSQMDPSVMSVLITAMGGDLLLSRLRERGVEYLRKPLDFERLLGLLGGPRRAD